MPSLRLTFSVLLSLALSIFCIVRLFEKQQDFESYLFVFVVMSMAGAFLYAYWDAWCEIREFRLNARMGDPSAMYHLALALRETNLTAASDWAEKGAAKGHIGATFLAGYLRYGMGLRDDETFDYFRRAAERGKEPAMRALADCYKLGHCVLPNDRLSFHWRLKSAADAWAFSASSDVSEFVREEGRAAPGNVCSQYVVGMSYLRGEGCEKSEVDGYAWLLLAATGGHADARKRVRELDRRKAFKLRAQMQDRCQQIRNAIENGGDIEPDFVSPMATPSAIVIPDQRVESVADAAHDVAPEPVSAWKAFFAVLLTGNLIMAALFIGGRASSGSAIRPELNGALFGGFIAAALFAAFSGRKLSPFLHLWLLGLVSVATSAALTFWGAPSEVAATIGAALACAAIFVPVSLLLIHWRHVVSDFVFYGMIALHALGFVYYKAN
jgi:TPR repeat protein